MACLLQCSLHLDRVDGKAIRTTILLTTTLGRTRKCILPWIPLRNELHKLHDLEELTCLLLDQSLNLAKCILSLDHELWLRVQLADPPMSKP